MLDLITNPAKRYFAKPFPFIYIVLVRGFASFITALATLAIVFLVILALTTFGLMRAYGVAATVAVSVASLIFLMYFWAAYKGSMLKSFINAEAGTAVHMRDYLAYAVQNGGRFFAICAVKLAAVSLLLLPAGVAWYLLKPDLSSLVGMAIIAVALLLAFIGKFAFSFTYIAAVASNLSAPAAIRSGMLFTARNILGAFAFSLLYALVWISLLIPIVNIFALLTTYPIINLAMINFYRAKSRP